MLTVSDTTIDNQGTATIGTNNGNNIGINVTNNAAGTGNLLLTMTGTNNVTTERGTGVLANNLGTGGSSITISDSITILSKWIASPEGQDGVEATTHTGGTAIIDMLNATGTITVMGGGNGILIDSVTTPAGTATGGGNVIGNIGSGVEIDVESPAALNPSGDHNGIQATTQNSTVVGQPTGNVDLATAATITTAGQNANGIYAQAQNGHVNVYNGYVYTGYSSPTGANLPDILSGVLTPALNPGKITTTGDSANGIWASATHGAVNVDSRGEIEVDGTASNGIWASTSTGNTVNAGAVSVTNSGAIDTQGTTANGILAYADSSTTSTATAGTGAVGVTNSGAITVEGATSNGIRAYTTTRGNQAGNVSVSNSGAISQPTGDTDDTINGILAYSRTVGAGATGAVTVGNTGNITLNGDASNGIYAYTIQAPAGTGAVGAVNVTNFGAISTQGNQANGIWARSTDAPVTVYNLISSVPGSGAITTQGNQADGILAYATHGAVNVFNAGEINVDGLTSYGIQAYTSTGDTTKAGNVWVSNSGIINSGLITPGNNDNSDGINASSTTAGAGATGTVLVENSNNLTTEGNNANGILAYTQSTGAGAAGAVTVNSTGGTINTSGDNSSGIYAALPYDSTGTPLPGTIGAVTVNNWSNIITNGTSWSSGIYAKSPDGGVTVNNYGNITTNGGAKQDNGIDASAAGGGANATVTVNNYGAIETYAPGSAGIWAYSGDGNVTVTNTGNITTHGTGSANGQSDGIHAESAPDPLTGATGSGNVSVTSSGADITSTGGGSGNDGIQAVSVSGNASVSFANGTVDVTGGDRNDGIAAVSDSGAASVMVNHGTVIVGGNSIGVLAMGSSALVEVTNGSVIDATRTSGHGAIEAIGNPTDPSSSASVFIDASSQVHGGWGDSNSVGVMTGGGTQTIVNDGIIDALSDHAILGDALSDATLTITNNGTITGDVNATSSIVAMTNNGVWNLRNFADTNGDGVRDTLAVSKSNLGDSGQNTIINNGTINLLGAPAGVTVDPTGSYLPLATTTAGLIDGKMDNTNNALAAGGPMQAQILGVTEFINKGLIDMTTNPVAGDVLVISGGSTAGQNGGGVYVSDGGMILMDTVMNKGGEAARSDILVVDSTQVGPGGATTLFISDPTHSLGAFTPGDGIPVVEVLNKMTRASAPGAFQLALAPEGRLITAGAYQYTLQQNGYTNTDGNWYLRNTMLEPPVRPISPSEPPPTEGLPAPPPGPAPVVPNYRPEVPVYMTAPALASRMGLLMIGTYHDRVGEDRPMNWQGNNDPNGQMASTVDDSRVSVSPADINKAGPPADTNLAVNDDDAAKKRKMAAWGRVVGQTGRTGFDRVFSDFRDNGPDYDFSIGALQAGFDVLRKKHDNGTRDNAGLYLGFMRGTADVDYVYSNGGRAGRVDMNGYSFGGYWTHKGLSEWYLDAVLQGTCYDQAEAYSENTTLDQKIYPNGYGIVASLEAGYPFGPRQGWRWEPQAQLIYQFLTLDNDVDHYGTVSYGDTSTWYGRIGGRLTKDWLVTKDDGTPAKGDDERKRSVWTRANIWHNFGSDADTTFATLDGNCPATLTTSLGDTWGQVGLGVSGELKHHLTVYAVGDYNVALASGTSGEAFSGEVGLRWEF